MKFGTKNFRWRFGFHRKVPQPFERAMLAWTGFTSPETHSIVSRPEKPNESGIIRSKLTPPGTPLVSRSPSSPTVQTVWECFETAIAKFGPERQWLGVYKPGSNDPRSNEYSWSTLGENRERILNVGSGLVAAGLKWGDRVGIYSRNCSEWIISMFANSAYGFVTTTLYESYKAADLPYMINITDMTTIITLHHNLDNLLLVKPSSACLRVVVVIDGDLVTSEDRTKFTQIDVELKTFSELESSGSRSRCEPVTTGPEDPYLICFTSGTTGTPKGAVILHRNVIATAAATEVAVGEWAVEESMKRSGYIKQALYAAGLLYKRTLLAFGINSKDTIFDSLVFGEIAATLGANEIKLVDVPSMSYFTHPVSPEVFPRGEICIRGDNVMKGYWREEEKTKETIDDEGWLHTGDVGELLPDGTIKIIDRMRNIFKLSQGEFVAVERIESVLSGNPMVQQIFIHGNSNFPFLVAVVVPEPDRIREIIQRELREIGKAQGLNGYEIPKYVHIELQPFTVEEQLITPTFKNKRVNLQNKYHDVIKEMYRQHRAEM
ncbi:acetyl-CoA synthetase-like protein [Gonapodya prolifera JEL478]|uniref:Acetyl-CoA synthetase-like protein n=1 Tax=Gonapodya prolifera (strain JEL478) TaxID=1344416 RepID=A0A139AF85_GONPJ|nr:acetyl-CoA synthetase-like protein [Gonapodya prolifera JEL478]|eukprot:KXS15234.1 acetyl-CoA synthetase-like protein [Gonapodya prolifera JEL478]